MSEFLQNHELKTTSRKKYPQSSEIYGRPRFLLKFKSIHSGGELHSANPGPFRWVHQAPPRSAPYNHSPRLHVMPSQYHSSTHWAKRITGSISVKQQSICAVSYSLQYLPCHTEFHNLFLLFFLRYISFRSKSKPLFMIVKIVTVTIVSFSVPVCVLFILSCSFFIYCGTILIPQLLLDYDHIFSLLLFFPEDISFLGLIC